MQNKSCANSGTHTNSHPGFTLVETLVAVAVLLIAIAAPLTLIQRSLSSSANTKDNLTAANLARDALEYVKNVRDTNLVNEVELWTTGLEPCIGQTCTVDTTRSVADIGDALDTVSAGGSDPLRYDTATRRYGYDTGDETPYTREVTITEIVPDSEYRVEVEVTWSNRGIPHTYRVGQNLFKLVSASGCTTIAVNNLHVGVDLTDPHYASLSGFLDCGMLLHYTFDGEAGGTTVADSSGFGNDGRYFGGTINTEAGVRGDAIKLDGNDDMVLGTKMDVFGDFTMTTWIRGAQTGTRGIAGKNDAYKYKGVPGGVEFMLKPGGADYTAPLFYDDGTWHHVAMSFDSGTAGSEVTRYYLDGALVHTDARSGVQAPDASDWLFFVGCWPDSTGPCFTDNGSGTHTTGGYWEGEIDDVRIYGRTLDDWEITALYDNSW